MLSTADDSIVVHVNLFGNTKGDDLFPYSHTQAREVVTFAFGPLDVEVPKRWILTSLADIQLDIHQLAANGCIDAVRGDDDAALEIQPLAQRTLP